MSCLNVENNKKIPEQNLKSLIYKTSKAFPLHSCPAQTSRKVAPESKTERGIVRHNLSSTISFDKSDIKKLPSVNM